MTRQRPDPRPRAAAPALRPAQQLQRAHRRRLHRRPVPDLAPAARAGARARGHRPRAHRLPGDAIFQGLPFPDRPHFSAFSYEACDAAFRDDGGVRVVARRRGTRRRRHRRAAAACCRWAAPSTVATARSCSRRSFPPRRSGGSRTGSSAPCTCSSTASSRTGAPSSTSTSAAAIPVLTITGSFGVPVEQALDIRQSLLATRWRSSRCSSPIVAARREEPSDDLISVLVEAEFTDEDGVTHRLSRPRDLLVRDPAARRRLRHDLEADGHHARRAAAAPRRARGGPGRPPAAAAGHRGVAAVDAHRPDVLPPRGA